MRLIGGAPALRQDATQARRAIYNSATFTRNYAMASDQDFIDYVCTQMRGAGPITSRRMFGEAALYFDGRVIGFVCDNQLFIKPVQAARAFIGKPVEKPPYPGAKLYFLIDEQLDDPQWLAALVRATATEVPRKEVKPKTVKKASAKAAKEAVKAPAKAMKKAAAKAVKKPAAKGAKAVVKKVAKKAAAKKPAARKPRK
jgi:TfoX/Sxy family transcriptional regulator of competence genes